MGFSHYTGQVTHHIDADIDAERDLLIDDLTNTHAVTTLYQVSGVGPTINARNGGGDTYYTDGEIQIAVIAPGATVQHDPPQRLSVSPIVSLKDGVWSAASGMIAR